MLQGNETLQLWEVGEPASTVINNDSRLMKGQGDDTERFVFSIDSN